MGYLASKGSLLGNWRQQRVGAIQKQGSAQVRFEGDLVQGKPLKVVRIMLDHEVKLKSGLTASCTPNVYQKAIEYVCALSSGVIVCNELLQGPQQLNSLSLSKASR